MMPSWYPTPGEPLAGVFFRELAIATRAAGFPVRVAVPQRYLSSRLYRERGRVLPAVEQSEEDNIPVYRWSIGVGGGGRFPLAVQYRLFLWGGEYCFRRYVLEEGTPDLIHAHSILWGGVLAAHLKVRYGIPFVVTEHSSAYQQNLVSAFERRLTTRVLEAADARTFVSAQLAGAMEANFGTVTRPWIWTPNMVDTRFRPRGEKRDLKKGQFVFLSIGFLVGHKGHRILLGAFARQFAGDASTRLRIAGDGPLRAELEGLAKELEISAQVDFLGALSRDQTLAEMQNADALVHASPFETFGVVLIEAMACGIPVIAASKGGPESIIHAENGILVPPEDPEVLGQAMDRLRSTINDYDSRIIREDCLHRFGEAPSMERLREVYANVLGARRQVHDESSR